ncbi:MAG: deaminase [archaeon]
MTDLWVPKHLKYFEETTNEVARDWLRKAYNYAWINSDDPDTKTGAAIVKSDFCTLGTNRLPFGLEKTPERLQCPGKYNSLEHAERDAIYSATRLGDSHKYLADGIMYMPWLPCIPCVHAMMGVNLKQLVSHEAMVTRYIEKVNSSGNDKWKDEIDEALGQLLEVGIQLVMYKGDIGGVKALYDGEEWEP